LLFNIQEIIIDELLDWWYVIQCKKIQFVIYVNRIETNYIKSVKIIRKTYEENISPIYKIK
jgi:hypothetical protein